MKFLIATTLIATSLNATCANAVPVTVELKAKVSYLLGVDELGDTIFLPTTDELGYDVSVGEVMTGYFTYDTATPLSELGTGNFQQSIKFANGGSDLSYSRDSSLLTYASSDRLRINTSGLFEGSAYAGLFYSFVWDAPYKPLGGYLPTIDQWSSARGRISFNFPVEGGVIGDADIISARVVSSVPEPSTYMMLGAGLGMMVFARLKRHTSPNAQVT